MDFDSWLERAWNAHAADAAGVAARIAGEGLAAAQGETQLAALARLAHHVYGEHLGRYAEGRALLVRLRERGAAAAALGALDASLALCEGGADPRPVLGPSDRARAGALAAGNLLERDPVRAAALLREALADEEAAGLADDDPAVRSIAITANNMACTLEEKAARSAAERELMVLAARTARTHWARAGTWLETERAEYRLANTWLKAGDLAEARRHAQACLEIVQAQGDVALEAFFGWEALGLVERAAGNATGHREALARARDAFERLDEGDRGWCRPSLEALAASGG
jgi:hypothetical protein